MTTKDIEEIIERWHASTGITTVDFIRKEFTTLTQHHEEEVKRAVEEERDRILEKLWSMREWHLDKKNQWAGLQHANTCINTIDSCREIVRSMPVASA